MRLKHVLIALVLLVIVVVAGIMLTINSHEKKMMQQDFGGIELTSLPDGLYRGSASAVLVSADAVVEIRDGRIVAVRLDEHRHGPDRSAAALCDSMVRENRVDVDDISGATFSSLIVKSAVLSALETEAER